MIRECPTLKWVLMPMTTVTKATMIQEAATEWTNELSRAGLDISLATRRLQDDFHEASARAVANGDYPIPDPVKLLRRLAALESRIEQLTSDCRDVADGRQQVALETTRIQVDNVRMLRQLSESRIATSPLSCSEESTGPIENWTSLASAVEAQHELFQSSDLH